jgi:hypothetical protein
VRLMVHNYMTAAPVATDPIARVLLRQMQRPGRSLRARGMNDLRFSGTVVTLDTPSDRPPHGSQGKRVVVPSALARATIAQWEGLPLNMSDDGTDHEKTQVIGHITGASIRGKALVVHGRLYDRNMAALTARLEATAAPLGMSFENTDAIIVDAQADPWVLKSCTWTGAAVLARATAAFAGTAFALAAAAAARW